MGGRALPVVFICDENYAMPTAVAAATLRASKRPSTRYAVTVLGVGLSEDSRARLSSLSGENFTVEVREQPLSPGQQEVVQRRERVSRAALLKFDLPLLFPGEDRLLYLDSDVAVQQDLCELFATDLTGVYAGVVKDAITIAPDRSHLSDLHFRQPFYFNSGMLLLNLDLLRQDDMPRKLLDYRLTGFNTFMDQDALNVVFAGRVRWLSPRYNLLNCFLRWHSPEELEAFYGEDFPRSEAMIFQRAAILHFGDRNKPWQTEMGYLTALYLSYYALSPYADRPLSVGGSLLSEAQQTAEQLRREKQEIVDSFSYRFGLKATALPRRLWRAIRHASR